MNINNKKLITYLDKLIGFSYAAIGLIIFAATIYFAVSTG